MKAPFQTVINKANNLIRYTNVYLFNRLLNFYCVIEYPKSGGSWLGEMVSAYFEIPFPRNQFPTLKKSIYHGHYLPSKRLSGIDKILFLVRDGRDVMVSLYFHNLVPNNKNKLDLRRLHYYQNKLKFDDVMDVKKNLPTFIDFIFNDRPSRLQQFQYLGNWAEFNKLWLGYLYSNSNVHLIKYEELLKDTKNTLIKIIKFIEPRNKVNTAKVNEIAVNFSFEHQSGRKKGQEDTNSFLRKGISGDWKNYFTRETCEIFQKYAGNMLFDLNYETDPKWYSKF